MTSLAWRRAAEGSVLWTRLAPVRAVWIAAERLVERATRPIGDDSLERAESVVRVSIAARTIGGAVTMTVTAWRTSIARAVWRRSTRPLDQLSGPERARHAGLVTIAAAVTALLLRGLSPRPEPLTWVVPAIALLVGVRLGAARVWK
jgi:hypothetical protein